MSLAVVAAAADFRLYICHVCGLIYDEARGDADSGLAAGTRFKDIPEDWACPICGVGKADFEPHVPGPVIARTLRKPAYNLRPAAGASRAVAGCCIPAFAAGLARAADRFHRGRASQRNERR